MKSTPKEPDYAALLDDDYEDSQADSALSDVLDRVHLSAPVTAKLPDSDDETKSLTDEEIDALTDNLGPDDLDAAIASRTPGMQALLNAEPEEED